MPHRVRNNALVGLAERGDVADAANQFFISESFKLDSRGVTDLEEQYVDLVDRSRKPRQ